jgi:hypothetical protein
MRTSGWEGIEFACSRLVPVVEGKDDERWWENYTVGPMAGWHSDTVAPLQFERASSTGPHEMKVIIMGNACSKYPDR